MELPDTFSGKQMFLFGDTQTDMTNIATALRLTLLSVGDVPALTPELGRFMAQACAVCLTEHKHQKGVILKTMFKDTNTQTLACTIEEWDQVPEQIRRKAFANNNVAAEHAAYGLACLLMQELTGYLFVEQSRIGTGFDYYIGRPSEEDYPLANTARLEVSGIFEGVESDVKSRVQRKLKQTNQSDYMGIPAYVVVVEFSSPRAHVVKK